MKKQENNFEDIAGLREVKETDLTYANPNKYFIVGSDIENKTSRNKKVIL